MKTPRRFSRIYFSFLHKVIFICGNNLVGNQGVGTLSILIWWAGNPNMVNSGGDLVITRMDCSTSDSDGSSEFRSIRFQSRSPSTSSVQSQKSGVYDAIPLLRATHINDLPPELMREVLGLLDNMQDKLAFMMVQKRWFVLAFGSVWMRPVILQRETLETISNLLRQSTIPGRPLGVQYAQMIRRLNLSAVANDVNDSNLRSFALCHNLDRLVVAGPTPEQRRELNGFVRGAIQALQEAMSLLPPPPTAHASTMLQEENSRVDGLPAANEGGHIFPGSGPALDGELSLNREASLHEETLCAIIQNNPHLHSIDVLTVPFITDAFAGALASSCHELQCLYAGGQITDRGMKSLAQMCPNLKRVKLSGCPELTAAGILDLVEECCGLVELDLGGCYFAQQGEGLDDSAASAILCKLPNLRELKIDGNHKLTKNAFVLPMSVRLDNLRLLSLGMCHGITDGAVARIVENAPKLRHIVLNKCPSITDKALDFISFYGPQLHYLHLGHCHNITDRGIQTIVSHCIKLQFVDVANCTHLSNEAVRELSKLPRLRRIGLVKCNQIDDEGIFALAQRPPAENTLERIHLSYCSLISVPAITALVNSCPRLTHLSLTGVSSFMRHDLMRFCRMAPSDLTQHQQQVFCVYSGSGVLRLRECLNELALQTELQAAREREEDEEMVDADVALLPV